MVTVLGAVHNIYVDLLMALDTSNRMGQFCAGRRNFPIIDNDFSVQTVKRKIDFFFFSESGTVSAYGYNLFMDTVKEQFRKRCPERILRSPSHVAAMESK